MDHNERESILQEAREAANDAIRSAAWFRVKSELDIMVRTLENSNIRGNHLKQFENTIDGFIGCIERGCFHE